MRYRQIEPRGAVAQFVRAYWTLDDDDPSGVHRIVPDGRSELILNLGQPYEAQRDDQWNPQPECFLIGQITGPLVLRAAGPVRIIGVTFHPHTAGQLLNVPMSELTDTSVAVGDVVSGALSRELRDIEKVEALDGVLLRLANRADGEDRLLSAAVKEGGQMSVEDMAHRAGLSTRQFERRFRQAVGISPKLFSRMQRFQRVFSALEESGAKWADAAVECGYYDQAHLIRDFQEFAGKPPAALLAYDTDLAKHFIQRAPMSDFSNTTQNASG
jgi:AraC-like DNA-binding protein